MLVLTFLKTYTFAIIQWILEFLSNLPVASHNTRHVKYKSSEQLFSDKTFTSNNILKVFVRPGVMFLFIHFLKQKLAWMSIDVSKILQTEKKLK